MLDESESLTRLRQALDRIDVEELLRRPGLARNVLADTFPDDPLAASLLTVTLEHGAVRQLQEQAAFGDLDLDVVAPRIAAGVANGRGLVPEHARWAVDLWSLALGLSDASPTRLRPSEDGETRRPDPPATEAPARGRSAEVPTRRAVPLAGPDGGDSGDPHGGLGRPASATAMPGGGASSGTPAGGPRPAGWRRRRSLTIAGAVVAVLTIAGLAYALPGTGLVPGDPSARSGSAPSPSTAGSAGPTASSASADAGSDASSPRAEASDAGSSPATGSAALSSDERALHDSLPVGIVQGCRSDTAAMRGAEFPKEVAALACSADVRTKGASSVADGKVVVVQVSDRNIHDDVRGAYPGLCSDYSDSDGNWFSDKPHELRGALSCGVVSGARVIAWSFDDDRVALLATARAGVSETQLLSWWAATPTPWG